jgi:nitronate monooxygenase
VSRFNVSALGHPIVQAPLAGGPSTVELAAAVCDAGGLGFLAAGYKTVDAVAADIDELRRRTHRPFGVNLFAPPGPPGDAGDIERYAERLRAEAEHYGVQLGETRHDDDGWEAKLELVAEARVPLVSVTFGCPDQAVTGRLHGAGCSVWVTVTTPDEARQAERAGADALFVQGAEAGGHRGSFDDTRPGTIGLLALLQLVGAITDLPLVAAGGVATGAGVTAALAAGAHAAALGTAFMLTPEAGTSPAHREAIQTASRTALTRAFTGRTARGIENRFLREHDAHAPAGYPEVHHLTAPIRAASRERGDAGGFHLWAGEAHALARHMPAADLVRLLAREARR